jgi:tetratricopeptide (TPR) repeat protein
LLAARQIKSLMSARLLVPPVLLALLALPALGQSADEIYCSNRNARLPADQVMAACDRLTSFTRQTDLWRSKAYAWRGIAHNRAANRDAALADFERAIELDDDNFDARYGRAQQRYNAKDYAGALEDLDLAVESEPDIAAPRLLRSNVYLRLKRHAEAIAEADNIRLAGGVLVLYQRCWTRAVAGVELDKARIACNQALWIQPQAQGVLDARGFLSLKERKFEAAWRDYNAVLGAAPRNARALYGRGIAAIALKREKEGRSDLAAAAQINTGIAAEYAADGVTPP